MKLRFFVFLFAILTSMNLRADGIDGSNEEKVVITKDFIDKIHGYDKVYIYHNGLAKVEKDEKYGFIDTSGDLVIPCTYDSNIGYFSEGVALWVNPDNKFCIVNKRGKIRTTEFSPAWSAYPSGDMPLRFGDAAWDWFKNGTVRLYVDNGQSWDEITIDKMGQIVENEEFVDSEQLEPTSKLTEFTKEVVDRKGNEWVLSGLKDSSGKIVVKPIFWSISDFNNGVANAILYAGEPSDYWKYMPHDGIYVYGYIDEKGNTTFTTEDFQKIEQYKIEHGF